MRVLLDTGIPVSIVSGVSTRCARPEEASGSVSRGVATGSGQVSRAYHSISIATMGVGSSQVRKSYCAGAEGGASKAFDGH